MMGLQLKTTIGVELGGWVPDYIVMRCYTCCMAWMIHSFTRMQCTVYLRHIRAWIYDVLFGKGAVYIITLCTHMFQGSTPWTSTWDAVYGYEHHALSKQSYWTTAETQHPDPCFTQLETQVTWKSDWITVEIKVYRPYAYICSESWCWYHILRFYWYSNIIVFLQNMCWYRQLCPFLCSSHTSCWFSSPASGHHIMFLHRLGRKHQLRGGGAGENLAA